MLINVQMVIGALQGIIHVIMNVLMDNTDMKVQMKEHAILQQIFQDMPQVYLVIQNLENIFLFVQLLLNFITVIELLKSV